VEVAGFYRHMEDVTRSVDGGANDHGDRCRRSATIWSYRTLPSLAESTGGRSMDEIKGIARVKLHPGKLDEWKRLTEQAMEIVRTRDPGTLQYEVFFNDDESEAIVFERYQDADAALEHFANIGHLMEPLMATATVTGEVLGTPNETMRAQLGGGEPKLFTPWMAAHD
jgi:quinol monooxygenase YgiN